jgi:hypothetical protein
MQKELITIKAEEVEATLKVKGQMVYVVHETTDYYLVSLHADGTRAFKADKVKIK